MQHGPKLRPWTLVSSVVDLVSYWLADFHWQMCYSKTSLNLTVHCCSFSCLIHPYLQQMSHWGFWGKYRSQPEFLNKVSFKAFQQEFSARKDNNNAARGVIGCISQSLLLPFLHRTTRLCGKCYYWEFRKSQHFVPCPWLSSTYSHMFFHTCLILGLRWSLIKRSR